ncbi:MAG: filamentous hemagglutinin N-terminal domain-containing protein [Betaproteobacteria bacterium]|nr:filamentous hemagglutinin N-terminal domain-containing protein [Betaproteobacteria bacterium]
MKLHRLIVAVLVLFQHSVFADITTDGSVGPEQAINANNGQFAIGQALGRVDGNNLFHSFRQFSLEAGETAIFTGENTIQNVISRVTGNEVSSINGILQSQVGKADFYFINPNGVVFGENAQIDVPGAFHISTAGELIFPDGSSFSALNPEASTLAVASPKEFGFTSGQSGKLQIVGGQLVFKPGTEVSLSANSLDIQQQAKLTVEQTDPSMEQGIRLSLVSIDSSTTQAIPIAGQAATTTGGELSIENSEINVSGNGAGRLAIRAGIMTANNSFLSADNLGATNIEGSVDVYVDSLLLNNTPLTSDVRGKGSTGTVSVTVNELINILNGGRISSLSFSDGSSGNVTVEAEQLIIDGQDTGIGSDALEGSGDTGNVSVSVTGPLQVLNGGRISSLNFSEGDSGNVSVEASQLIIDGNGNPTGIGSDIFDGSGNTGDVLVSVTGPVQVLNGGRISSLNLSASEGNSGDVEVNAKQLTIDGNGNPTGIGSDVLVGSGNTGDVLVSVTGPLQVLNGGRISSLNFSEGDSGNVTVTANQININGEDTGIGSDVFNGSGNTGDVLVSVDGLTQVLNGGRISSLNFSVGGSGKVTVKTQQLIIDGEITGISSEVFTAGKGNAGNVEVSASESIQVLNEGRISSSNFGTGNAGAAIIDVAGSIQLLNKGLISTTSIKGDGGNIEIDGEEWVQLQNATITAVSNNQRQAGNITIDVPILIMDTGKIIIDPNLGLDTSLLPLIGGSIEIIVNEEQFLTSGGIFNPISNPNSKNIIQSPNLAPIISPELNIVGALVGVTAPNLDMEHISQDPCANDRENSWKVLVGHRGTPAFQHGENYLPINRFDEPDDIGTPKTTTSINTDHENISVECAKAQRTSLN